MFTYNRSDGTQFKCALKCMQCRGKMADGTRCPNTTCEHLPYCERHLGEAGLQVKPSKYGLGLFATRHFNAGQIVCKYNSSLASGKSKQYGELLTQDQIDDRYGRAFVDAKGVRRDFDYAPYAVRSSGGFFADAACSRSAASYANDYSAASSLRRRAQDRKQPPNATFVKLKQPHVVAMKAVRNIRPGEEILCDYQIDYWKAVNQRVPKTLKRHRAPSHSTVYSESSSPMRPRKKTRRRIASSSKSE